MANHNQDIADIFVYSKAHSNGEMVWVVWVEGMLIQRERRREKVDGQPMKQWTRQ